MDRYDLIAVGGGAAGLVTAAGSAGIGARVALVERDRLGGECLWTGCVPSKALLACAKAAAHARGGARFGVHASVRVEFAEVMDWVDHARAAIEPHDSPERFRGMGIDVIQGTARFTGDRVLDVDGRRITAPRIVVATGSRPAVPPIPGLADVPFLTNENVFDLRVQPEHLLILGGGAIGLELAQAFARLGSRVTVVESGSSLLAREDAELVPHLQRAVEFDGVVFRLGSTATAARLGADGGIALDVRSADGAAHTLHGTHLLVAVGRQARTDTLDLAAGGVEVGPTGVIVDDSLRTTAPGVWAAGDCTGGPRLTHVADYQARLVIRNAFFPFNGKASYRDIPWVTYTDPELAHAGLTEQEARERHADVRCHVRPFDDVDRAIADGETIGMVKLVTRRNGELLGGHVLGAGAGQMIGEIALALSRKLGVNALAGLVHPYPSMPEAIRQAAEGHNKARFTGVVRTIARWFARR